MTAEPKGGSITVGMGVTAAAGHVVLTDSTASVAFSGFTVHFDGKVHRAFAYRGYGEVCSFV